MSKTFMAYNQSLCISMFAARSLAAGSQESRSMKGSMIMAPDGEIISVGGSVSRPHDVANINDVTQQHRPFDCK